MADVVGVCRYVWCVGVFSQAFALIDFDVGRLVMQVLGSVRRRNADADFHMQFFYSRIVSLHPRLM
jgi:hypothetical protein